MLSEEYWCCSEFGVYALSVVVVNLQEQCFHEKSNGLEPGHITEVFFELTVKGFLESILPRRSFGAEGCLDVLLFEQSEIRSRGVFTPLI